MLIEPLYFDNHILAFNKPAGILSQGEEGSFEAFAKLWLKEKMGKPGDVFLHAVHRLDKPTSGILVFAKTSKALARLNEAIREGSWQKTYLALVEGTLREKKGVLSNKLCHASFCSKETKDGKKALLEYRVACDYEKTALLEVHLKTGRYHQIRKQLSLFGHPIAGDFKYGSTLPFEQNGIALHHYRLIFIHPVTKQEIKLEAPCPFLPR